MNTMPRDDPPQRFVALIRCRSRFIALIAFGLIPLHPEAQIDKAV